MLTLVILEGVVVAILTVLVIGLLQSHAEILRRLHRLDRGSGAEPPVAPEFATVAPRSAGSAPADLIGETPSGEAIAIGVAGAAHHTLLAFLSSGCATCAGFWSSFARPERLGLPAGTRLVAVTRGADSESVSAIDKVAPAGLTVVMSTAAWESYAVPGSPYFVLVDGPGGRIAGEGTGSRWTQVQSLMGQAVADKGTRRGRGPMANDDNDAELLAAGIGPGHASLFPGSFTAAAGPTPDDSRDS